MKRKVRSDLIVYDIYGGCLFVRELADYIGKEIDLYKSDELEPPRYKTIGCDWNFSPEMFEPIVEQEAEAK